MTQSAVDRNATPHAGPYAIPLAVYVHWPFCLAKCPYCDFNSHVAEEPVAQARWRDALVGELAHYAEATQDRTVTSVFFGGGTPSLMAPETAAAVLAAVRRHWPVDDDIEVTLEANPTSVERERFADFAAAGINRASLGVQSLDDQALAFLGRGHSAAEARVAVAVAADCFRRYSFDLIYARPDQGEAAWRYELAEALEMAGDHLSVYQLTIEPGTAFHKAGVVAGDSEGALFEATQDVLAAAGLAAYEISNHARPGAECRHNLNIWRGGDYIGIGPGAHGRVRTAGDGGWEEVRNIPSPAGWLRAAEEHGHGIAHRGRLEDAQRAEEVLMLGLRLTEGIDGDRFRATGIGLDEFLDTGRLADLVENGDLTHDDTGLSATETGRRRLNAVIAYLLT